MKITNFGSVPTGVGGAAGTGGAVGGDLAGTTPAPTVVGIQGVPVDPTPPTPGQELVFNGTAWAPASGAAALGDHKVLVDGSDTTAANLLAKLGAGAGVTLTVLTPGGNEQVQIGVTFPSPPALLRPLMAFDGTSWWVVVDGFGNAIMV